jgi:hypothetical protein
MCLCMWVADWVADVMVEVTSVGKCVMVVNSRFESGKRTGISNKECKKSHLDAKCNIHSSS